MSSAANALLWNIAEGKQCNLLSYFSAHTRPPQRLNRAPKAGLAKSRGRHGSFPHYAHRRPNFTGDRSEARGHGAAHAQGARAGAHLTVSPRASVEGARRVLQRRKARAAEALRRRGAR